jgi:hypothetical protein
MFCEDRGEDGLVPIPAGALLAANVAVNQADWLNSRIERTGVQVRAWSFPNELQPPKPLRQLLEQNIVSAEAANGLGLVVEHLEDCKKLGDRKQVMHLLRQIE